MSVNMDVGVQAPPGHFGTVDFEADQDAVSFDWVEDLMLGVGATLSVLVSCSLSVLIFLT